MGCKFDLAVHHLNKPGRPWSSVLYTKIQPQNVLSSGEKSFKSFIIYGHAAVLFSGAELFEEIGNTLSTEDPMWNLVKIRQAISEKTFKN